VVAALAASKLPVFGDQLRVLAAASCGAVAGLSPLSFSGELGLSPWVAALGGGGLFAGCYLLLGRGASPYALAYGGAALALFSGMVF
jgi:hypothetical protein